MLMGGDGGGEVGREGCIGSQPFHKFSFCSSFLKSPRVCFPVAQVVWPQDGGPGFLHNRGEYAGRSWELSWALVNYSPSVFLFSSR